MSVKLNHQRTHEAGIALVLAAVALLAVSSFLLFGAGFIKGKDRDDSNLLTRQKMDRIMVQLAVFAQMYNRLPCAAAIDVSRTDIAFGREDRADRGDPCASYAGIVPFRALGIQEREVRDAWGRYMTYAVSPVFTELDNVNSSGESVGDLCRLEGVWVGDAVLTNEDDIVNFDDPRNVNPSKAKFCCPNIDIHDEDTDIAITKAGDPFEIRGFTQRTDGATYNDIDSPLAAIVGAPDDAANYETVAVTLISHGYNGIGAFLGNAAGGRMGGAGGVAALAADEAANAGNTLTYFDNYFTNTTAGYFDDIVLYKTQYDLYSMLNNGTCLRPYR